MGAPSGRQMMLGHVTCQVPGRSSSVPTLRKPAVVCFCVCTCKRVAGGLMAFVFMKMFIMSWAAVFAQRAAVHPGDLPIRPTRLRPYPADYSNYTYAATRVAGCN